MFALHRKNGLGNPEQSLTKPAPESDLAHMCSSITFNYKLFLTCSTGLNSLGTALSYTAASLLLGLNLTSLRDGMLRHVSAKSTPAPHSMAKTNRKQTMPPLSPKPKHPRNIGQVTKEVTQYQCKSLKVIEVSFALPCV